MTWKLQIMISACGQFCAKQLSVQDINIWSIICVLRCYQCFLKLANPSSMIRHTLFYVWAHQKKTVLFIFFSFLGTCRLYYSISVEEKKSQLTAILSSRSLTRILFLFQEMVGSGWPLGGIHSKTAGSPAATTTSLGVWRKSSLRTAGNRCKQTFKLCINFFVEDTFLYTFVS